jgi:DnaJ domain
MSGDPVRELRGADPYQLLGLDRTADDDAIVAAHRRLVKKLHPDVASGGDATTTLLNLAREVLRNPTSRLAYDRMARDRQAREDVSHQPEQAVDSPWDDVDVVSGVAASPIPPTGGQPRLTEHDEAAFLLLTQPLPGYGYSDERSYRPPSWWSSGVAPAHAPAGSNALGITALFLSVCALWPLGLIVGVTALFRGSRNGMAGYVCALVAVVLSGLEFLLTTVLILLAVGHSGPLA